MALEGRRVRIVESDIPGPYNLLDLPEGHSVTFVATRYQVGRAIREVRTREGVERIAGPIMRVYVRLDTPVFGAPYLDILAGRTIAMLEALFRELGLPLRITLTASGVEPQKWYEVSYEKLGPPPGSPLPV
ncbi:MAG: hypothetical protein QXW40_07520 [Thermofilum sp.]